MTDQNFEMFEGDTKDIVVTVTDSAGAAVDLTGAVIAWQMARTARSATPAVAKSVGSGIVITDAPGGICTISLDSSDTGGLSGDFYHELEVTDAQANITTVLSGTVTIKPALIGV